MKNHHEVGHFRNRLMIVLLSLSIFVVTAGQSFAATGCTTCHGMPPLDGAERSPSSGAFKGNHQTHMGASATAAECTKCHGNSGYLDDHAATANYMIKMNPIINNHSTATYDKPTSFAQSANPFLSTCSNVNCHFEKNTTNRAPAPAWGTKPVVTCNSCHDTTPATGNHARHLDAAVSAYGENLTCASCHPNYGTTNFSHATSAGKHPIVVNNNTVKPYAINYGGTDVTSTSWLPSVTPRKYGNCSTYCHSNGTVPTGYTVTAWGTTNAAGCAFCHPNLSAGHDPHLSDLATMVTFYNNTSNKSSGGDYKFGCANCHPVTVGNHLNGTVEVDLASSTSGGRLKSLNGAATINGSKQCLNVYCHSNGYKPGTTFTYATTPVWGGSFPDDKCANCHGNSPNSVPATKPGSPAHTAHLVGIHYENIYSGVTNNLPPGGAANINAAHGTEHRSTTINCNICHAATVTTSANDENTHCAGCHNGTTAGYKNALLSPGGLISNAAKHVNGAVDVVFVDQKIATKAQVADSAFAAYTAQASGWVRNSNGMPYKTYTSSYDYTKSTLFAAATPYSTANGCLNIACHASIPVKWTDAPFSCNNCHTRLR